MAQTPESTAVFPARAGMSPSHLTGAANPGGVPRASGDEPPEEFALADAVMCSPRERG